jgi:hypothetical protein
MMVHAGAHQASMRLTVFRERNIAARSCIPLRPLPCESEPAELSRDILRRQSVPEPLTLGYQK